MVESQIKLFWIIDESNLYNSSVLKNSLIGRQVNSYPFEFFKCIYLYSFYLEHEQLKLTNNCA